MVKCFNLSKDGDSGREQAALFLTIIAIPLIIQWVAAQYRVQDNTLPGCRGFHTYNPTVFISLAPTH